MGLRTYRGPSERNLQTRIIKAIRQKYGKSVWVLKVNDSTRVGIPDLIICFYGLFVSVEIKKHIWNNATKKYEQGRELTPMQEYNIKEINLAGGSAFMAYTLATVMKKLDRIYKMKASQAWGGDNDPGNNNV